MRSIKRGLAVVVGVVLAASLAACNDDSDDAAGDATATGPEITLSEPSAPLQVDLAQLGEGVPAAKRAALTDALSKPLSTWVDGAFLDAAYPTSDFAAGFASWTPDAAKLAKADGDATTNAAIGDSAVAVVADKQNFRVFVFAENGKTGGATARVDLKLTAQRDDGSLSSVLVKGEVYLTRDGANWKIFGYDLSRTEAQA